MDFNLTGFKSEVRVMTKNEAITEWIDNNSPFVSYFWIRGLVKSAMDNTLKADFPKCPFSAKDIIEWAKWNDEESYFMTAGAQAISAQTTVQKILGAPEINPLTEKKNTTEAKNGAIVNMANSAGSGLLYAGLALGAGAILFQFLSSKARKMGGA